MAGGIQFDFVGTDKGVVKTFEQIQVSIRKTASTIEELKTKGQHPIDSLSNQIASLQIALANNDRAINASRAALKKFAEEAKEALEAGDFSKFNAKQTDYSDELENLRELIAETDKYKQVLEDLTTVGIVNKEGTSLFFATEYDFRMMKQAKEKVAELQEQIGKFQGSDEDLTTLRESLSEANDELRKAEDKARDAAEALGGKLGAKAAETSERLYEVNDAVKKQSKIVDDLTDAYNEAVRAVNALEGSDDIAAREQAVNNYEMLAEQLQNAENHLVNLKNQQKEAQTEWDKTNKEIESQNSIITKLCGGQEKLNEIMSNLPAPLNKAITGLQGMTGAAKAFIATPLGVVLAALIIAWETLTQWFERSEEGQMALAKVTGYFTGILEVLKDTAASVGEFLYKMFTDPIEAGKSFVSFLKGQVVNRLKAVGDIGFAIGKILSAAFSDTPLENMKQGYKDLTNAVLQLGSGVEKPLEKMGKAIENIGKKANESAQIAYDEKMIEREEHKTKRLIAEEEKRARELRTKRGKRTKEEEKELKNIEKKITDAELGIINKKIALQERSMANSKYDSIEENNKLDDLYAEKARIEGRNNQRLAQIEMQGLNGRNQQTKKLLDTQAKIREDALKREDELDKKKLESRRAQEDAIIAAIKEDAERERKEREVQYKRTIEDLKAKEDDIYKQIYQQRKTAYETANKDKKYLNTDEGAAGWKGLKIKTLQEVQDLEFTILAELGKSGIINAIEEQFGKGNVDLISRPLVDAAELVKKGWKEAGDGIATVFSSQYGIEDKEGQVHEILVTPILPDGTVLSEAELKKYIDTTLQGADDILKADELGIVIAVDVDKDGSAGEALHKLQEQLIDLPSDKLKEIQQLYASLDTKKFSSDELMQYKLGMDTIKAKISEVEQVEKRRIEEETKKQKQALNEYLKEFGNAEEKRAAIAAEYDEKIRNARTEGERLMVQAQKEAALNAFDTKQMQKAFNFEDIFNNLGNLTLDRLNTVRDQLREMLNNNDLDFQNYKAIAEQIDKVNESIIEKEAKESEFLGFRIPQNKEIKKLKEQQAEAMQRQLKAYGEVVEYELKLTKQKGNIESMLSGMGISTKVSVGNTDKILSDVESKGFDKNSPEYKKVKEALEEFAKITNKSTNAQEKKEKADNDVKNTTQKLGEALKDVRKRVGDFADSLQQINANIQSLPGLMDSLGLGNTKAGEIMSGIASGANDAMGAMADFSSGNYIGAAAKAVSAINTFGETFGAWSNSNRAEVEAANKRLSTSMDVNSKAVDRLTAEMKKQSPKEAFQSYEKALAAMQANEQAARQTMLNNAGMYDGGHSLNYDLGEADVIREIFRLLGKQTDMFYDLGGLLRNLTAEDWNKLWKTDAGRKAIERLGIEIGNAEDEGNYNGLFQDLLKYMDDFSDEAYQQLHDTFQEAVIGVSFDSFKDKFKSALLDMSQSASDFSEDFTQMMYESLLNSRIETLFGKQMQELYDAWESAMSNDDTLDANEIRRLTEQQEALMASMRGERDRLAKLMGIDSESTERIKASLDSIKSAFSSLVTDTEADMDKWGRDLKNTIINNLIESMLVGNEFEEWAKEWSERFNNLWNAYNNGEISQSDFNRTLDSLNQDLDEMAQQTADKAAKIRESLSYAFDSDELNTVFSNLHDTFLSTLTNIEEDAKDFKKSITDIMLKDLIDQQVLGKAFTINDKTFESFDTYLEEWNKRYANAMKEGNQAILDALVDELVQAREITVTAAEDLRERLKTVADDTTFTSMESSFVSALMDMDGDVEDFADNLKKTIIQKLVEGFMVSERIKPLLEDLQNTFDHAMSLEISPEEQAAMIAQGYTDAEGIIHKGINDVAEEMKPMQTIVTGLLEAIGYKGKEVEGVFASLGDTIKSSLMNLDDGFESFMDSITETIVNDLTESYMATEEFQEGLKDVKKGLEDALNAIKDANTEEEIAAANEQLRQAKEAAKGFYEAAEEGTEAWREALRKTDDTTFTALEDSFVSALSDMDKTAEDWGQEIGLTLANKIIEQMVVPTMIQPLLKNVQKAFDDAVEAATSTDDEGNAVFDWGRVLGDEALANAIADMKEQYPELKALIESIMGMAGVETSFSNSLDSLSSVFLDRMLSLDEDAEDIGKQIGATLINEMLEQMLSTSVYADRMEEIRRKWQDILTGKNLDESGNTLYTMEDVLNDISTLESDIANNKDLNALADKYKEITATAKEGFSDLEGVFTDSLVAMDATAETFGKQIGETMLRQMLDAYVGSQYKEQIKNLNQEWAEALESGNADAIDGIKAEVESLYAAIGNDKVVQDLSSSIKEINKEFDTTFKSMSDSWVSNLMDMNSTAEKWAEDVGRAMAERIIAEMVVPTMIQPLLDNLQNVFNSAIETANGDWSKVLGNQALREALDDMTAQYPHIKETVKGIMDMLGLDTRADYRYSGFSNLSDTFLNTLKSIKSNAEDFSSTIGTDMAQQMAQSYIDSHYGEQIENYNEQWQQALESGNTEAMAAIRTELEALYATMGNDQALQKLIDDFREFEEIPNLFADMRSTFVSSLMNMEDDAESFAKSIATTLTEKMVDDIIEKGFTDKIEQLGEEWREALESGDMAAIDRMTEKLTKLRDEMGAAVSPLLDAVKEINRQTDTTFSDMTDSWVSALMNMEGTAEEWAENIGKTMAQKIISELIAPIYIQPVLDRMQEAFNLAMEVEGASVSSVINEMRPYLNEIEDVYNELSFLRDDIFSDFDISVSVEQEEQEIEYALNDLKSNFVSSLMDMKNTTEDFSKDISKILAQTFIERFVLGTQFDQQMAYWQQQYENIIGSGMTEDERKRQLRDLRNSIASAKESYVDQAAAIQELFGLTTEDNQQATMNMSDKITYDQADQLLGINLAQELTLEQILATLQGNPSLVKPLSTAFSDSATNTEQSQQIAATLLSMAEITRIGNDNILTQIAVANSHLQMIRDYAKTMRDEIVLHLGSMDSKLTSLKNL